MQLQKFSHECPFCTLTTKVFPLESFAIYGRSSWSQNGYDDSQSDSEAEIVQKLYQPMMGNMIA